MATIVTDGTVSGGGGGTSSTLLPGYFDSTDSVFCCHFDEESSGTWTSVVGNDLTSPGGTAPTLVGSTRKCAAFAAGGLSASLDASAQITGDVTMMVAFKNFATATTAQWLALCGATGETEAANYTYALSTAISKFKAWHEYSGGLNTEFTWNSAESPEVRYTSEWHVATLRRDSTGALGTAKRWSIWFDWLKSAETAYTNDATGGTTGVVCVGADPAGTGDALISTLIGGVVIFDSALTDSQIAAQVDRILSGAAKV